MNTRLKSYFLFLLLCWTILIYCSLFWMLRQERQEHLELALTAARSHLEKDLILREWNIRHGFVYAPVSDFNQPNPYLQIPEREVTTPSGRTLTIINSAAMIRQLYMVAGNNKQYLGHLTSLKPIRPENAPDEWEIAALGKLQAGQDEVFGLTELEGKPVARLMRPLKTEARCLKCHVRSEAELGKIIGGLSVAIPVQPLAGTSNFKVIVGAHGLLWLVGLVGLVLGHRSLQRRMRANEELAEALRREDEEKRILLNNIPALVYRGYADGRVEFVDDKVEKLTGYPREQFASGELKWPEIIVPEDRAEAKRIFVAALKGNKTYRREYRIRTRDGGLLWIAERSQIVLDEQGRIRFVSGVMSDISLRKEMEQALAASERFWKSILEAVGVGIILTDKANGRIQEINPRALAMLGYPKEAVVGQDRRRFLDYRPPESKDQAKSPSKVGVEAELLTADGRRLPILKTCAPLEIEGLTYILESFVDLSAQKQAEQELATANARLQQMIAEVDRSNQEINLIGRMVELLQVCQNLEEAYPVIRQFGARLFKGVDGAVFLVNPSSNLLYQVANWGGELATETVFSPQDCWALRRGRRHLASSGGDLGSDPPCRHLQSRQEGVFLCHPLVAQGDYIGLFHLQRLSEADGAAADEAQAPGLGSDQLAASFAENISLALANLRLRESLRHQAIRDPLTGLFNRRYLQETLERELYRVQRKQAGLGVIMLDVDHFKQFNDTYGHEAGDRLLAVLGRYLRTAIRAEDIACRYGGEEFLLVLPEINKDSLAERAEAIRAGAPELEVEYHGQLLTGITISLGLAWFPEHGTTGEQLVEAADKALYRAKRTGRNRVVLAGQEEAVPQQGQLVSLLESGPKRLTA